MSTTDTISSVGKKRSLDAIADEVQPPVEVEPPVAITMGTPGMSGMPEPPGPPVAIDLGPGAFRRFGMHHLCTRALTATVTRNEANPAIADEVVLEVTDVDRIGGEVEAAALRAEWSKYAAELYKHTKAVFRGGDAVSLALLVDATNEAAHPGLARTLLQNINPGKIRNNFKDPLKGEAASRDEHNAWKVRNEHICSLMHELNARIAEANVDELAKMHTNRRLSRPVFPRSGRQWATYIPYIRSARKPADGEIDLSKAMLVFCIYTIQIDGWEQAMTGSKDKLRKEVAGLSREIRDQLEVEYAGRV